jgi:hypothetical protein
MPRKPIIRDEDDTPDAEEREPRLSQNGQMVGIAVYGGLVLVGFFFGVVTGYEPARPPSSPVAKAPKDKDGDTPKPEPQKPEPPKPEPKLNQPTPPAPEPKNDPVPEPKMEDPKPEPKVEPKVEPKMEATPPPKKEEPKEFVRAVSFEKDVKPILRRYCFSCHGDPGAKPKGDVDLTSLAKITDPKNPPILKPGDPKGSAIFFTIEDLAMPPKAPRPGKGELQVIHDWIKGGAKP